MRFPASSRHFTGVLTYPTEISSRWGFSFAPVLLRGSKAGAFLLLRKNKNFFEKGVSFFCFFVLLRGVRQNTSRVLWKLNTHSSGRSWAEGKPSAVWKCAMILLPERVNAESKEGERSRTVLKYPVATDKAMKRIRVNDTSLWGWRRTRQRWDSYGLG